METLTEELRMTVEETSYRSKKFSDFRTIPNWECTCSSCGNKISPDLKAFNSHPVLGILQCQPCADQFRLLQSSVDEDTIKDHCLICARNNPSSIYTCTGGSCNFSFCKKCIKRNAANTLLVCEKPDWRCFVCNTKPLWQRRGVCAVMMASNPRRSKKNVSARQSFSDSDDSSEESTTEIKKKEKPQSSSQINKSKKTVKNDLSILLDTSSEDGDDFKKLKIIKPTKINSQKIPSTQVNSKKSNSTQVKTKKKSKSSSSDFQKKKIITDSSKRAHNVPRVEALSRMNSDSSSGKEFTQTKILKDSYVSLQKLDSIHENIPSMSGSSSSSNVLSKTEALNLKKTTQKYFDDLAAVSRKLLNDIETAKKFYMKKDVIKPIDATQFIVECKNIACSLIKRTEDNEKKLINQYSKWCKRTKVKNIFLNPINNSQQIRKRTPSISKEKLPSSSSSSDDEEDKKKEEKIVEIKKPEKELEVSECDSEQIFSDCEREKSKKNSKSSSIINNSQNNKKQNLETSGIESEDSNENNSDIEKNLFSSQAGGKKKSNSRHSQESKGAAAASKEAGKSDQSVEDIFAEDDSNVSAAVPSSRTITVISDDSAEDGVFSSPDLKRRKINGEEKTKGKKRDLLKEEKQRTKAKLVSLASDSSDVEKTEFRVSQQPRKSKELILDRTSDSDNEKSAKKTDKKNQLDLFDSSDDEADELPTGAKKIISNGLSNSDDDTTDDETSNKKKSRKDGGNSPEKTVEISDDEKSTDVESPEKKNKDTNEIDSDSTDVDEAALLEASKNPEELSKKNSGLKIKEKQNKYTDKIDSDSTDVDESAPTRPKVISDESEGEATEPEASKANKLSKKNSGLKNKDKQNEDEDKIDSDSTDVDESAPSRPKVISDSSEGEATELEDPKAKKLSKKKSGLEKNEKQKEDTDKIDSDSTDVDESAPKIQEIVPDASEDEATDHEEWVDAEDNVARKVLSRNSNSTEYEEFEPLNNSKEEKQLASKDRADDDGSEKSNSISQKISSPSPDSSNVDMEEMAKKTLLDTDSGDEDGNSKRKKSSSPSSDSDSDSSQKQSKKKPRLNDEEKNKKKLFVSSSESDGEMVDKSSKNEENPQLDEENIKKKLLFSTSESDEEANKSSDSQASKSGSKSPKQGQKDSQQKNEEKIKKKLLASSSESDEEIIGKSSENGSESPRQNDKKLQHDNEEKNKKKLLDSSSESDEEAEKSNDNQASKNGRESPKPDKKNSQQDDEEKNKKKLLASSSESDDKSSKDDSESPKQGEKNSQDTEEKNKNKLLNSSSESDEDAEKSSESPKPGKKNSQLDDEEKNKNKLLASTSDSDDKSSKSDSDSRKQDEKNKNKLLASTSDSDEDAKKSSGDKSSDEKDENNSTKINKLPVRSKLSRKFRIKNNKYYKNDAKLRSKCMVKVQRIPPRALRKYAKALKKSKEYIENKKLKSLVALDDLERVRNRDRVINSSSEEEETSTSTRNRKKKTAKESEETLMDHLKNLNNGDTMDVDDSVSEDEERLENPQQEQEQEEVTDLEERADKIAQNNLLRDSDSNSEEEVQDSDAEEETKAKKESQKKTKSDAEGAKKKSSKNNSDENNDSDIEMEDQKEVNKKKEKDDKGRWRRNAVLTANLSSSDSDEEAAKAEKKSSKLQSSQELKEAAGSDDEKEMKKKKRARRQRLDSDSDVKITDFSSNSDSDARNNGEKSNKSDNEKSKKKRTRRKKGNDSSDSDLSIAKGKQKAKRRRIKTADTDSDDDDDDGGSSVEEINNSQGTPGKSGRKNIRRVLKDTKVADDTKQAAMQEEERLKRMADRQKIYNEMYEVRLAGEKKVDNLVLDFDEESKEELLSVHENLVKKLKPHQAQGIKFMWDACFESLERAKTTKGSGAILAHCMGLGKSFQIVTLSHTLLANNEITGVRTVMVVCPLSTILNWVNEFKIWLKEVNGDEDEIEVYEMTKMKKNSERKWMLEKWQKTGGVLIIGYEMYRNLSSGGRKATKKIRDSFIHCLVDPGPDLVVCDEGHLLKSENTATSKAMSKVRTLRRIVLTGTPLQNNLVEYHCMVQFVKPNLLGTKKEFLNRFVNPINNGQFDDSTEYDVKLMKKRAHVLHKMLEGSVQRFDYSVLTPFLPPKQEYVIFVKLTEVQIKLYQYYIENLARRHRAAGGSLFADFQALQRIWTHPICIKLNADKNADKRRNNDTDSEGSLKDFIDDDDDSDNSSSSIQSMSSISGSEGGGRQGRHTKSTKSTRANPHPLAEEPLEEAQPDPEWWSQYVEEDHFEDMRISSKLLLLFDILKESENIGDKVLVFSQSLYSLTLIEKFLAMLDDETQKGVTSDYLDGHTGRWTLGLDYFRLDGQTSTENRSQWCKIFNRPTNTRARLFLISTRAGGLGINLTAANRVIIFDASWNPSHDVQSIFRIYRFGQKKPCYVYRLLAAGTMEEKIYNRQVTKLSLSCRVVDEQQIERHYSNNDLAELYKYEHTDEETASLALPKDRLLAEIFLRHKNLVRNYHEHDSLLENKAEEELDEEERQQAWREYEDEKAGRRQIAMPMMNYQDQMMQQFNAQMMNQSLSQLPEFEQIRQLIQKDYPNATPDQQLQITKQAMVNMYAYIENQHLMRNMQNPVVAGRPPMQLPQAAMPMQHQQISKPPNPTNTLANMLAQQEYARHHNTSSKKMSAQQKQIQYAQQFGNYRSVPVPSIARPAAAPTPQRSTSSAEPEIIEIVSPPATPASTSNSRRGKKKFQEE